MNASWQTFLADHGALFSSDDAVRFNDNPQADVALAADGTVVVPLVHLGAIRASGEDSATFLHNLLSNDVKKIGAADAQFSSFNSPKGRMLASLLLWRDGPDYVLALSADIHAAMLKKLSMYVLRSKVKLSDDGAGTVLIGLAGRQAVSALEVAGLSVPTNARTTTSGVATVIRLDDNRFIVAAPNAALPALWQGFTAAGARPAGTAAWQWLDIQAGLPLVSAPVQEEFVPQMINFDLIDGISFTKGCYPGQEIVARTRYLGKLKKRMFLIHGEGDVPSAGTDLYAPDFGDQSAGKIVSAAPAPNGGFDALAVLQISSAEAASAQLGAPDGPVLQFKTLPYALA